MNDVNWLKSFNSKGIYSGTGQIRSDAAGDAFLAQRTDASENRVAVKNSVGHIGLTVSAAGNHGIYSHTRSKWIAYCASDGNVYLNGHATSDLATSDLALTGGTITGSLAINSNLSVSGNTSVTGWFRTPWAYTNTSSSAANVQINSEGTLRRAASSSKRYKHDIRSLAGDLDAEKLLSVPVVQYIYNEYYLSEDDPRYGRCIPGFIAEDIAEYYPIAAETDAKGQVEDWNIRLVVPPMLALVQKGYRMLGDYGSRLSVAEARQDSAESRLSDLQSRLASAMAQLAMQDGEIQMLRAEIQRLQAA